MVWLEPITYRAPGASPSIRNFHFGLRLNENIYPSPPRVNPHMTFSVRQTPGMARMGRPCHLPSPRAPKTAPPEATSRWADPVRSRSSSRRGFSIRQAGWKTARRVVAKGEDDPGEWFPRRNLIVTNLTLPSRAVVRFYNKRGTAEPWIKEGKQAVKMTRLSCHRFRSNEVRLWLSIIAYNLGNLWRRLVLPQRIGNWSLTSLQQRLVKTGGRLVKHARYYWLLLAESHLTRRFICQHAGADRWTVASVGMAQAATPKKPIPISARKGEVSEKAGSGSRDDRFSGPGKGWLGAGGTLWEKKPCPEGSTGGNRGVYSQPPEGQKTNSGLDALPEGAPAIQSFARIPGRPTSTVLPGAAP